MFDLKNIIPYCIVLFISILTVFLLFYWEDRMKLLFRLPVVNLFTLLIVLVFGTLEQFYLTCNPSKRTKWIRTSIFQLYLEKNYKLKK